MNDESLLNDFLEAASMEPDDPLVLFGLTAEYFKLQRYDEAIKTAQHLITVQPDYSAAHKLLGQALAAKGDTVPRCRLIKSASGPRSKRETCKQRKRWKSSSTASRIPNSQEGGAAPAGIGSVGFSPRIERRRPRRH